MGSALAIPLQAQAPQPASPLQTIGQIMGLKGQMSDIALRNAQIQQAQQQQQLTQVEQAQKNRDLADQNTFQEAMKDPAVSARVHTGDFSDLESKIQPKNLDVIRQSQIASQNAILTRTLDQNKVRAGALGEIVDTLNGLQGLTGDDSKPDLGKINSALPGAIQHLSSIGALKNAEVDVSKIPSQIADPDQLNQWIATIGGLQAAHEKAIALQKTQADVTKSGSEGAQAQAAADLSNFKLGLMRKAGSANPQDIATSVKGMSIFAGHPQEMQDAIDAGTRAYQAALTSSDPTTAEEKAQGAVKDIADRLRGFTPGVVAGKATEARATGQATLGVHEAEAGYQNALQQGDKASADYFSSLKDAKQAVATANTIQQVIDLSKQTGNPVAMQQLKAMVPEFTNAAQQIKRMSGGQNAGLSSSLDNAINELTSAGGKPLSDATIAAITPYVKTIANGAVQQHNANVEALSKAYPQKKFAPESIPYGHVGGHFIGESVPLKNGRTVKITKILPNDQFEYE